MPALTVQAFNKFICLALAITPTIYFGLLSLIIAVPSLQTHLIYLHRLRLTGSKDLNIPEQFGFLHNQATPFPIQTSDGEILHAWHILPLTLYRHKQQELEAQPAGFAADVTSVFSFQLLRDDPDACLVIHLHGAAGTIGSGYRPDNYRTLSSSAPEKIHVLSADYRGFGHSTGTPSESGLLIDAVAVVDWAMHVANVPASRIVLFGQSLGTAVAIAVSHHFASQVSPPALFAGMVLVAPFTDVATLTRTYHIGGLIPVLSPLSLIPRLLAFINRFLKSTWQSSAVIAEFIRHCESTPSLCHYHITLIHAEDDTDIPFSHTETLFRHAVDATVTGVSSPANFMRDTHKPKRDLGPGGSVLEWRSTKGVLREEILKYGLHDKVMSWPVVSLAVLRAFQAADPGFARS